MRISHVSEKKYPYLWQSNRCLGKKQSRRCLTFHVACDTCILQPIGSAFSEVRMITLCLPICGKSMKIQAWQTKDRNLHSRKPQSQNIHIKCGDLDVMNVSSRFPDRWWLHAKGKSSTANETDSWAFPEGTWRDRPGHNTRLLSLALFLLSVQVALGWWKQTSFYRRFKEHEALANNGRYSNSWLLKDTGVWRLPADDVKRMGSKECKRGHRCAIQKPNDDGPNYPFVVPEIGKISFFNGWRKCREIQ